MKYTLNRALAFLAIVGFFYALPVLAASPAATNLSASETYTEDTPLNLIDIVTSDDDGDPVIVTLTLSNPAVGALTTGTSGAVTSTYNAGTGVWTASGAIANVNTLLTGLTFVPAANGNSSFTIATSVSDGGTSVSGTKTVVGIAINDAPTATNLSAAETYTEDMAKDLTDIVVGDVDSNLVTVTLTLSNSAVGDLSTGTAGDVTSTFVAGVWTATGSPTYINTLLAGVTFTPVADGATSFTIATRVTDGVASALTGTKAVTATAVNDAPVFDTTKTPSMGSVLESSGAPTGAVGVLVSSLVDFTVPAGQVDNISDADSGASTGIAIVGYDSGNFTCYYSTNGGAVWSVVGAVSESSARLLASDADNRVYCDPGATLAGLYTSALTIRAWDQTSGSDGGLSSVVVNGGSSAFSVTTDTVRLSVVGLTNTAPVAEDDSYSMNRNASTTSMAVLENDYDIDNDTIVITDVTPDSGTLGTMTITDGDTMVHYYPANGFCGTETFTYTISDGNGGTDTGTISYEVVCPIPPTIVSVTPAVNSVDQSITSQIVINFSEQMAPFGLVYGSGPCNETCPTYSEEWSNNDQTLTLTPSAPFEKGTTYTFELTTAYNYVDIGNSVEPYSWSFTTVSDPVVVATSISSGRSTPWGIGVVAANNTSVTTTTRAPYQFPRNLKQGMKGDDVVVLQKFLGVVPVASKNFGPKTKAALAAYQKENGLVADGILGPKSRAYIEKMLNQTH